MFGYMLEPRSKDYYDDDADSNTVASPWKLSDILLFPFRLVFACVVVTLLAVGPYLYFVGYLLVNLYTHTKTIFQTGKLSHPRLAWVGFILAVVLGFVIAGSSPDTHVYSNVFVILAICFVVSFTVLPFFALILHLFTQVLLSIKSAFKGAKPAGLFLVFAAMVLAVILCPFSFPSPPPTPPAKTEMAYLPEPIGTPTPTSTPISVRTVDILVDDFSPQPYQGESIYFFNRLEGDRGAVNDSILDWADGEVTTTIAPGNSWGGVWMSLNHPIREALPINFSAVLPAQIAPAYQSQITGLSVHIVDGTPGRTFKVELKERGELHWKEEVNLQGGQQDLSFDLPALGNINELVWVLDHASPGDYVVLDSISFTATTHITDTATAAFVWSYGMLLNNWNPSTGLVRDKAREASGEFDAIQATGCLAAATAVAKQLGVVTHDDAVKIVAKIGETLLTDLPRYHGLWPHWVKVSSAGEVTIVADTEWSSVDTAIAVIALLEAQNSLGLDTSGTTQMLEAIEWGDLTMPSGIAHGYAYTGEPLPYAWDVFGGESWLIEWAYAAANGRVTRLAYAKPPTANGSGFIDELAWLFAPSPPGRDYWKADWASYRLAAADSQIAHSDATTCLRQSDLFGLSAAEVPSPWSVAKGGVYQAFGMGGRFAPVNDGAELWGTPAVVPHYAAMIASLRPEEAIEMWSWLIENGYFSPLTNVESLTFPSGTNCAPESMLWNHLKGSWNLSLQTLGWGRYLAEREGDIPILWQAAKRSSYLSRGYILLAPASRSPTQSPGIGPLFATSTNDNCLALHSMGLPECRPPSLLPTPTP